MMFFPQALAEKEGEGMAKMIYARTQARSWECTSLGSTQLTSFMRPPMLWPPSSPYRWACSHRDLRSASHHSPKPVTVLNRVD